ncbi:MAG: RsmD family RNA methyltransferase, partial [Propionibacteriaceae bacterium]|nr:RsmD family RNA methyltransferase [Propionibacteriaceae bacterium]
REAVFAHVAAWLGRAGGPADEQFGGLAFLDLYAGTGAVGLEAASRGAADVWWVERDAAAARALEQRRREWGAAGRVCRAEAGAFLAAAPPRAFDLVWLDPPYDLPAAAVGRLAAAVWERGWITPGGLAMVERPARSAAVEWPLGFAGTWVRQYGGTSVCFATQDAGGNR